MKKSIIALLVMWIGVSIASAQSEATQLAENECMRAVIAMTRTYKKVLSKLENKAQRKDVEEAQKAWLAYREAEATARAGITSGGGSAYNMDYMANMADLTDERTAALKKLLKMLGP